MSNRRIVGRFTERRQKNPLRVNIGRRRRRTIYRRGAKQSTGRRA